MSLLLAMVLCADPATFSVELTAIGPHEGVVSAYVQVASGKSYDETMAMLKKLPLKVQGKLTRTAAEELTGKLINAEARARVLDAKGKPVAAAPVAAVAPPPPPAKPASHGPLCIVDTPEGEVSGVEGGLPCAEAEKMAVDLRGKGFDAKAIPVKK